MGVSLSVLQIYNDFFRSPNPSMRLNIRYLRFRHTFCYHLAISRENAVKAHIKAKLIWKDIFKIEYIISFFQENVTSPFP